MIKFEPAFKNALEISNPKPELAPVMIVVLWRKDFSVI